MVSPVRNSRPCPANRIDHNRPDNIFLPDTKKKSLQEENKQSILFVSCGYLTYSTCLFLGGNKLVAVKRRTQADRSSATRQAILEAARDTIADKGYSATTTLETARRAGVSRGAQLHHYATKQDLLLSVIDYIHADVERDVAEISRRIDGGPDQDARLFINELWNQVFSEDNFNPNIELITAARTNPELAERLKKRWKRLAESYDSLWSDTLKRSGHHSPEARALLPLTLNFLRGLALQRIAVGNDPEFLQAQLDHWSEVVKLLLDDTKGHAAS
jgi:AcrR family transcriptional regulator